MEIISILNHKGGVGKTTTSTNLLAGLTRLGKKVLAIDLDGQANLSYSLGVSSDDNNIYTALTGRTKLTIMRNSEGLEIVPSSLDLQAAEIELSSRVGRELILKKLLSEVKEQYDYIIIDCPPSLGILTLNALTASTGIIIPVEAETLALKGMSKLIEVIDDVKDIFNKELSIKGILITKYDKRKNLNKSIYETIEEYFPNQIFKTVIRDNVTLAEAPMEGKDIFTYANECNGAIDYLALSQEIINQ